MTKLLREKTFVFIQNVGKLLWLAENPQMLSFLKVLLFIVVTNNMKATYLCVCTCICNDIKYRHVVQDNTILMISHSHKSIN